MTRHERASGPAAFAPPPVGDDPSPVAAGLRSVATAAGRHRRLLAAVCAGAAVVVAVSALTPGTGGSSSPDAGRPARSALLPVGAGSGPAGDAERVAVAVRLADPAGLLLVRAGSHAEVLAGPSADVAGMPLASGTGSGTGSGTASGAGSGAGSGTGSGSASGSPVGEVLAADAVVLAVPQPPGTGSAAAPGAGVPGLLAGSGAGGGSGGLDGVVVLAVPPADARRIAAAAGTRPLSVAVALAPSS
jgi:hypothetical protein